MSRPKSALEVQKFGGASLADPPAIRQAVEIIRGRPLPTVVVVSALAGVTDLLLRAAGRAAAGDAEGALDIANRLRDRHLEAIRALLAGKARDELIEVAQAEFAELASLCQGLSILRELTPRTSDFVVGRGERLSARLVAAALAASGVKTRYVDALEVVPTDGHFGNASPDLDACDRAMQRVLRPLLRGGITPVLPGFVGAAPDGQLTTLGRGGSDLTAALAGRALGASRVNLWKDVPGLLTADPRVVPGARVLPQLNVREAAELAYYGAKVLHPRALIPIVGRPVPLFVRPFADPQAEGTEVSNRETGLEVPVKALSAATGQALVTVEGNGMLGVPGVAARTFQALHRERISVSLITQASSEHSICFSVPAGSAARARACLEAAFQEEISRKEIDGVSVRPGVATIAVVGLGMAGTPGVAQRLFTALASRRINVIAIAQGSSELNISAVVDETQAELAQVAVHEAFQLGKVGGGSVTPRDTLDLLLLGFGKIGRAFADLVAKLPANAPKVRIVAVMDRSGVVFEPQGLSVRRLLDIAREKERGHALRHMPGGQAATADSAVVTVAGHALSHPVLVDVTAEDTLPLIRSALAHGMDVVLANKRPLSGSAADAEGLWKLAREHGRRLRHEATVGAGLPVMDTIAKLQETGDEILSIEGCLSGTLGFILSELERGRRFSQAVTAALQAGYSEPDPRDDLSGQDVARKALILGRLIGFAGEPAAVAVESLVPNPTRSLPLKAWLAQLPGSDEEWAARLKAARSRGAVLRYVASVTPRRIKVGLVPVPAESPFASLRGTDNLIVFTTERYHDHPLAIRGPGAGPQVTAAGVLNDVLALARR
ncbi:MAG TPA: bifunctional aspartate kinase/homoserine dehydrogenase I [Gemmatimonadales bacterium]|jgi:aspartokinase/homoserine dehydrogenase 1|nr:bifunctional aspartate kinase/homoserine dehydrogenase I [Gemmatimonadales bacterium]